MLLHRMKKHGVCYAMLLSVFFFCMAQCSDADDDLDRLNKGIQEILESLGIPESKESQNNEEQIARVLKVFNDSLKSDNEQTKKLLNQWENYLFRVSHYSNDDFAKAFEKQLEDYRNAIADLNNIIEKTRVEQKKEYSSIWVDDLIKHFGKDYIRQNRGAILQSWKAVSISDAAFEKELKNVVYIGTLLYGSYKDYFRMFFNFYKEEIDDKAKKKLEPRKKLANAFLAIIDDAPYIFLDSRTILRNVLAENKARHLNEEVFQFLKTHPLSHTFGDPRALKDLRKVVDN